MEDIHWTVCCMHHGFTRIYRDGNFTSFTGWAFEDAIQEMDVEPKLKFKQIYQ